MHSAANLCSYVNLVKTEVVRGQTLLSVILVQHLEVSRADFVRSCTIVLLKSHYCLQRCEWSFTAVWLKSASDTWEFIWLIQGNAHSPGSHWCTFKCKIIQTVLNRHNPTCVWPHLVKVRDDSIDGWFYFPLFPHRFVVSVSSGSSPTFTTSIRRVGWYSDISRSVWILSVI